MLKSLLTVLLLTCLVACSPQEAAVPEHMDKQKMAEVMTDLSLMEAAISMKAGITPGNATDSSFRFNIYKQHNISRELYNSSLTYYSERPKEFKEVYDLVLERLDKMK